MRKKEKCTNQLKNIQYYVHLKQLSVNVVLIVIDAEEGIIEQDKRVAGYAHEEGKAVVIVVNKWDTVDKDSNTMKKFADDVRNQFQF